MIEVEQLTKRYGNITAISGISFTVARGEVVGFLGPNGAGKSTTMRILTGFFPASSGTAKIDGFEVHQSPIEVKRRVGYMPERVPLYEEMSVLGFLRFVAQVKGVPSASRKDALERAMEHCGLGDMRLRQIGNLSKGYRQRVGLAQALLGAPPVLILDEPTAGLDPKQIVEIRELIHALRGEHTVLISTHILPEVSMVCDRAIIIHQGRNAAEFRLDKLAEGAGAKSLEEVFIEVIARGSEAAA